MKGRKKMFLIEKRNVAHCLHHYDFKHHFLKCRTPFSVALPFYATASAQILLGSPAQTSSYFWMSKGPVSWEWPQFQASTTLWNKME